MFERQTDRQRQRQRKGQRQHNQKNNLSFIKKKFLNNCVHLEKIKRVGRVGAKVHGANLNLKKKTVSI